MKNIIWLITIGIIVSTNSFRADKFIQAIDTIQADTIEIDPERFQDIGWVDTNQVEFIFLPLDEEYPFGEISKILFRDQKIFIKPHNMGRIYVYTDQGVPYSIISHSGKGPGEYLHLSDFEVNTLENQIIVSDAGNRKFVSYSYSGEFIGETPVNFFIKLIKSNPTENRNQYIVDLSYSKISPEQTAAYSINLFDENWDFIKGYFPFTQPRGGMFGHPHMLFSKSETCIGYYKTFTDSIFHFNGDDLSLAYYLDFPAPVYSYEEFESDGGRVTGDRVFNITYDESTSHLFLGYLHEGQMGRLLYDKESRKVKYFTSYSRDNTCSHMVFSSVLGLHGSILVLQSNALNVDCIVDIFKDQLTYEEILRLNQVREVDNNILVLVQL